MGILVRARSLSRAPSAWSALALAFVLAAVSCMNRSPQRIAGTIVEAETGAPVTEFSIGIQEGTPVRGSYWTTAGISDNRIHFTQYGGPEGAGFEPFQSMIGQFEIAPEVEPPFTLFVEAIGYARTRFLVSDTMDLANLRIALDPERSVSGTVVSRDGKPISGCRVVLGRLTTHDDNSPLGSDAAKQSEPDGSFTLHGLPKDLPYLTFLADGYGPRCIKVPGSDVTDLEVLLDVGRNIDGIVTWQGRPAVNQIVNASFENDDRFTYFTTWTHTNASGEFRLSTLPAGKGTVVCRMGLENSGLAAWSAGKTVDLTSGDVQAIDLAFARESAGVKGRVSAPHSSASILVGAIAINPTQGEFVTVNQKADQDGAFEFPQLPPGTVFVRADVFSRGSKDQPIVEIVAHEITADTVPFVQMAVPQKMGRGRITLDIRNLPGGRTVHLFAVSSTVTQRLAEFGQLNPEWARVLAERTTIAHEEGDYTLEGLRDNGYTLFADINVEGLVEDQAHIPELISLAEVTEATVSIDVGQLFAFP